MRWKIINLQTDLNLKAGFDSEELAQAWLEKYRIDQQDIYIIESMDEEEEAEWLDSVDEDELESGDYWKDVIEESGDEDYESGRYDYQIEDDDNELDENIGFQDNFEDDDEY